MKALPPLLLGALLFAGSASAATINVPADQATIQAAIDAANNGDTVLVAPGTYYELIDFKGKAITVKSSGGAAVTIFDGRSNSIYSPIVSFKSGETNAAVLQGFTFTHSFGGPVYIFGSSPTIMDDVFVDNSGYAVIGSPPEASGPTPVILRDYFADNVCTNFSGGSPESVLNLPTYSPTIADNVFVNNSCPALIVTTGSIYNNSIVGNQVGVITFAGSTAVFSDNLIAFNDYGLVLNAARNTTAVPTWSHNLVYGSFTADYQGLASQTGKNGNISADPMLKYWIGGDVHLLTGSPAIDAGDSSVSQASATDFYGAARVFAGKPGGAAIVDIGAAESITPDDMPGTPTIINVPADQPTIQTGIDAAVDGEVVLVAPGTYHELLDFKGKVITLKSSGGPAVTILDGNGAGPIVNFHTGEWIYSVLQGFTLTHAYQVDITGFGPAVNASGTSPTIEDNVFTANEDVLGEGGAITISGSPIILRNYFTANSGYPDDSNPYCVIGSFGGAPVIADNVFANNPAIAYRQISGGSGLKLYNNTMVGNAAGFLSSGGYTGAFVSNNIMAFNQVGVAQSSFDGSVLPSFAHNLVYGNTTANYQGVANQTRSNGNISVDPKLKGWADGDVHLLYGSPALDVGDGTVLQASATDFYGVTRLFPGIPAGPAVVDIGAAEYQPPVISAADGALAVPPNTSTVGKLASANADPGEPLVFALLTLPVHGSVTLTHATTGAVQYVPAQGYLGPDSFTFEITDPYGMVSNTATEQVTVADLAPVANDGSVQTAPDIVVTGLLSAPRRYPSQKLTFSVVSIPAHGTVIVYSTGQFKYTPDPAFAGSDSFTFQVTDQLGKVSNTATEQVTIAEVAPVADADSVQTTPDTTVTATLTVTRGYTSQKLNFTLVAGPTHGTVSVSPATGLFQYTPVTGFAGSDSFSFKVTDSLGTVSNVATETVTVHDLAPKASAALITVTPQQIFHGNLVASKAYNGQVLHYQVVSRPLSGTLTLTDPSTGAYTFSVPPGLKVRANFTFQVVDQWGTVSNIAQVRVVVL